MARQLAEIEGKDRVISGLNEQVADLQRENRECAVQLGGLQRVSEKLQCAEEKLAGAGESIVQLRAQLREQEGDAKARAGRHRKVLEEQTAGLRRQETVAAGIRQQLELLRGYVLDSREQVADGVFQGTQNVNKIIIALQASKVSFKNLQKEADAIQQQYFDERGRSQDLASQVEKQRDIVKQKNARIIELEEQLHDKESEVRALVSDKQQLQGRLRTSCADCDNAKEQIQQLI